MGKITKEELQKLIDNVDVNKLDNSSVDINILREIFKKYKKQDYIRVFINEDANLTGRITYIAVDDEDNDFAYVTLRVKIEN